jgi:hypothetical protein
MATTFKAKWKTTGMHTDDQNRAKRILTLGMATGNEHQTTRKQNCNSPSIASTSQSRAMTTTGEKERNTKEFNIERQQEQNQIQLNVNQNQVKTSTSRQSRTAVTKY